MRARTNPVSLRTGLVVVALACLAPLTAACTSSGGGPDAAPSTSAAATVPTTGTTDTTPSPPGPAPSAPTPTFEAASDAFRYGDDGSLDELWDACAAGSGKACDDLYFAAPVDSEYETFGYTCGDRPNVIICTEIDDPPAVP